ncbi:MAG TPA: hypothetical protein VGF45_14460 [Polyangia bacterium]
MKTSLLSLVTLGLGGSLLLATPAHAQTASVPTVAAPATPPGAHLHDGFYLRLGTGFGSYSEGIRQSGADKQTTVSGIANAFELAIGGAVRPGLIFGGGLWSSTVLASSRTVRGTAPPPEVIDSRGDFQLVGPFFDYYTNPRGGFHMQGAFGLANVRGWSTESANFDEDSISVGGGLMFGVGYDWWVSKEWSIGILGRMTVGITGQEDKADVRWYHAVGGTPSVLFTGTYN